MSGLLRRAGLRRTATLRNHRQKDPVTSRLHDDVLRRDKECVAAKLGFAHVCRDAYGVPHAHYALPLLTVEHVKDELGMSLRAPSDMGHLVTLCAGLNLRPPSKEMRAAFRAYLAGVNTRCWVDHPHWHGRGGETGEETYHPGVHGG